MENWLQKTIKGDLSLADLDEWVYPTCLRRYQLMILRQQDFKLIVADHIYRWLTCTTVPGLNLLVFERCSDGGRFLLRSDGCGTGFALESSQLEPCPAEMKFNHSGRPALRLGDPNFAHFLWNELDPLLRLLKLRELVPLEVVQHSDSILDVAALEGVQPLPLAALAARPSVHAGAIRVTASARAAALHSLGAPPEARRANNPLLVLGVRGPGRRELVNEVELLCALIHRLRGLYPELQIALDGFTYQRNNMENPRSRLRELQVGERIEQVLAVCGQEAITSLNGLAFGDYLQRIAGAWCYVTHEGTIQHKIGWMYPSIPGVCLAAGPHAKAIANWHLLQCEGASSFESLPVGLLVHTDAPANTSDRNQRFTALNLPTTVEAIVQRVLPHLEPPVDRQFTISA